MMRAGAETTRDDAVMIRSQRRLFRTRYVLRPSPYHADANLLQAYAVADMAAATQFRKLYPGHHYEFLEAEAEYAIQEYACTACDMLARRTRLAFLDYEAAVECTPRVVEVCPGPEGFGCGSTSKCV